MARSRVQEIRVAGSPPQSENYGLGGHFTLLLSPAPLPTPAQSSHIPLGNRKPQLQPRLQTAPPSGAGGVGGEARGHRAKVSFVPARGGEGPGEDRGGQGRVLAGHRAYV